VRSRDTPQRIAWIPCAGRPRCPLPYYDRNFRRSLSLEPNNANTHHWFKGDYLLAVGRTDEAIEEARRARALDPLSLTINGGLGRALFSVGRAGEAMAELRNTAAMDTTFPLTNEYLGSAYIALGRSGDAVPVLRRAIEPRVRLSSTLSVLGYALAKSGQGAEAKQLLKELQARQQRGYISPTSLALLYAGIGDTTQVFAWLRRAVEARDPFLIYNYVTYPLMAPFRRDPRGKAILEAIGLSQR